MARKNTSIRREYDSGMFLDSPNRHTFFEHAEVAQQVIDASGLPAVVKPFIRLEDGITPRRGFMVVHKANRTSFFQCRDDASDPLRDTYAILASRI